MNPVRPDRSQRRPAAPSGSRRPRIGIYPPAPAKLAAAAALLSLLCLAGCDRRAGDDAVSPDKQSAAADLYKALAIEKPAEVEAAPDFTLKDLSGKPVPLRSFRGKVVFLNFWATWCAPCIQEMPTMEKLHREFQEKGLIVLAVNYREEAGQVSEFLRRNELTFENLLDPDGAVAELYQVWGLPASLIIEANGTIAGKVTGARDWHGDTAREFFRRLLAQKRD